MAKNTNRVARAIACVAALGLATAGVWAQTDPEVANWQLDVKDSVTFAQEIFGGDNPDNLHLTLKGDDSGAPAPEAGRQGTRVELQLNILHGETVGSSSAPVNAEAEVTITIEGAVFGQAVQWTDIDTGLPGTTVNRNLLSKKPGSQKGGRAGENWVAFSVQVPQSVVINDGGSTDSNDLTSGNDVDKDAIAIVYLGSLNKASGLKTDGTVTASATVVVTNGPTDNNFPVKVGNRPEKCVDNNTDPGNTVTCEDRTGAMPNDLTITAPSSAVIADSELGMTFEGGDGAGGVIDIKDRTKLGREATMVPVASLTIDKTAAKSADGNTAFSDGVNANISVSVSGMIRDEDEIFFDVNNDMEKDTKEELSIASGVASKTVRLSEVSSGAKVYYKPGGTTPMRKGKINASFVIEYDSLTVTSPAAAEGSAMLNYEGVASKARAYAIPNAGMGDIGNVRIKCDAGSSSECTVFLECYGQDGMDYFGELDSAISGGATTVLQAEAIGDAINTDAWAGRLSCDVLSNYEISVQVLVRSDGSLINNTYVD